MNRPELHWVQGIDPHRLALMPRPRGGEWLADEVASWHGASVNTVVSLLEAREVRELDLDEQPVLCRHQGIEFLQFPITDRGVPASDARLLELVSALHDRLQQGRSVAIHCRAGIGRTGLVAACLLHLLGVPGRDVFHLLSRSRGVAVPDTQAQAEWGREVLSKSRCALAILAARAPIDRQPAGWGEQRPSNEPSRLDSLGFTAFTPTYRDPAAWPGSLPPLQGDLSAGWPSPP